MDPSVEVIVLSDDDDAGGDHTGALDSSSILIVEENEQSKDLPESNEILDEDVTITFSRRASVLPHARYDCDKVFSFADSNVSEPEDGNAAYCEQCFCYICDRPASQCKFWTVSGFCHCNAHKRSVYWKSLRDTRIMGYLHELKFTFDPADMDSDLRRAETSLQEFAQSLTLKYGAFSMATENSIRQIACGCPCHSTNIKAAESSLANRNAAGCSRCYVEHQKLFLSGYTPVMACVCAFLDEATKETPKTGCIMALGAIKLFITHSAPGTVHAPAISHVALGMFWRAMSMVQVLLVDTDFPASFVNQLQHFFQILPLPPDFRKFRNGLNVLSWDDPLLSAVLKGQNVTGMRQVKGRRTESLHEAPLVVRTRVVKLQEQDRYRELVRYLRVVKSDNNAMLQMMRDWVPLYLCKVGDYTGATDYLLSPKYGSSCPASRLSPAQFAAYLRILVSGDAPLEIPQPPRVEPGSNLLKRQEVMKFALRVLNCNSAVFAHAESWIKVMEFANLSSAPSCLAEPNHNFLSRTRDIAIGILNELHHTSRIQIPKNFQNGYPNQALLLLATQALAWRLLHSQLKPILHIILTFKLNPWVMHWLFNSLLVQPPTLQDLFGVVLEELADGRCRSILRIQDTVDQYFIASFLCLFFLESRVVLNYYTYPVTDLLAKWNEFENPWQYHLRRLLEVNESSLNTDKKQILNQMIQWGLRQ